MPDRATHRFRRDPDLPFVEVRDVRDACEVCYVRYSRGSECRSPHRTRPVAFRIEQTRLAPRP